jgi:AraC-like DNA-binding protein
MKDLERYWHNELLSNVRRAATIQGPQETCIEGVSVLRYEAPVPRRRNRWTASVGLIIQGAKEIEVGRHSFRFSEMSFIASPLDLPVSNQIVAASAAKPFLVLNVRLDAVLMSEVTVEMEPRSGVTPGQLPVAIGGKASPALIESFARLSRLFTMPGYPRALARLLIKEIYCHLLTGPEGLALRQFLDRRNVMHTMSLAVSRLHVELSKKIDVEALARAAHMSRSAFFKNFRLATRMSPIQYQKQIRLLEARRLMSDCGETAEDACFKVGYKSASQFSREYVRYFGDSPRRDVVGVRRRV